MDLTFRRFTIRLPSLCIGLLWIIPAAAATTAGQPDHVVPAWYLGMPVVAMAHDTLGMEDRLAGNMPGDVPSMNVYVTAPVSPTAATSPQRRIELPGGPRTLPAHQITLPRLNTRDAPRLSIAWFVIPGPAATVDNLQTDPRPEGGWSSGPLARAIRIGGEWVPLNSHVVIDFGLQRRILALEYFDGGSVIWATPDWQSYQPLPEGAVTCTGGIPDVAPFLRHADEETP